MNDHSPHTPEKAIGKDGETLSANGSELNLPDVQTLTTECQLLREKLAMLEQERDAYRQKFEQAAAEAKEFHGLLTAPYRKQISEEQLYQWAMDDNETGCVELADFIQELEAIVRGPENG